MSDISDQTDEERITTLETTGAQQAADGISSTSVDGMTVNALHPLVSFDVADRIRRTRRRNNPFAGLRSVRIISPGAGE
jgi:hypothetical protein